MFGLLVFDMTKVWDNRKAYFSWTIGLVSFKRWSTEFTMRERVFLLRPSRVLCWMTFRWLNERCFFFKILLEARSGCCCGGDGVVVVVMEVCDRCFTKTADFITPVTPWQNVKCNILFRGPNFFFFSEASRYLPTFDHMLFCSCVYDNS